MLRAEIIESFRQKVSREIDLEAEGLDRYIVYTPFMFDDGDHYVVVLRRDRDREQWVLTDEAHTFMHLSYADVDLTQGTRRKVIDQALTSYRVENNGGELRLAVPDEAFGDALFTMVQAIGRITGTALWTRERVRDTFDEDFRSLLSQLLPPERVTFDYTDPTIDPDGVYPIDCRINGMPKPCFVFKVANDHQCRNATITCYHYERHHRVFSSMVIYRDQTEINGRALAQLTDVVGKQFASLGARDRIEAHLRDEVLGANRR
jgi:hypothetical protein